MQSNNASRVQKHRATLRASGLRPVQIWVPDTRQKALQKNANDNHLRCKGTLRKLSYWVGWKKLPILKVGNEAW